MFFSIETILSILAPVFIGFSATFLLSFFSRGKSKHKYGKSKLFKLLSNNFEQNIITNKEDIMVLINSISREFDNDYSIVSILEDYIVYLSKDEVKENSLLININSKIKEIIEIENQEKPFNRVPSEEKRILKNINENLKNNQLELAKINLQELGSVIATRNIIYIKADKISRWSLPIAIIGIIFTIIFGFLGLIGK